MRTMFIKGKKKKQASRIPKQEAFDPIDVWEVFMVPQGRQSVCVSSKKVTRTPASYLKIKIMIL